MIKITEEELQRLRGQTKHGRRLRVEVDDRGTWLELSSVNDWAQQNVVVWRDVAGREQRAKIAAVEAARLRDQRKDAQLRKLQAEKDIKSIEDAQAMLARGQENDAEALAAAEATVFPEHQPTDALKRGLWCKCGAPFHFSQNICARYVEDLERAVRSHRDRLDHVRAKHGVVVPT